MITQPDKFEEACNVYRSFVGQIRGEFLNHG